jgi:hypothetical protein
MQKSIAIIQEQLDILKLIKFEPLALIRNEKEIQQKINESVDEKIKSVLEWVIFKRESI